MYIYIIYIYTRVAWHAYDVWHAKGEPMHCIICSLGAQSPSFRSGGGLISQMGRMLGPKQHT